MKSKKRSPPPVAPAPPTPEEEDDARWAKATKKAKAKDVLPDLKWTGPKVTEGEFSTRWVWRELKADMDLRVIRKVPTEDYAEAIRPVFAALRRLPNGNDAFLYEGRSLPDAFEAAVKRSGLDRGNTDEKVIDAHASGLDDLPRVVRTPKPSPAPPIEYLVGGPSPEPAKEPRADDAKPAKARYQLFGYSMGEILRWMGVQQWTVADATKALAALGCYPAADTIRWQLKAALTPERYGKPAPLTKAQQQQLRMAKED